MNGSGFRCVRTVARCGISMSMVMIRKGFKSEAEVNNDAKQLDAKNVSFFISF